MLPRVQVAPIIGLPQYRGWSQVAINSSKSFVCVFAIEGDGANSYGRDLAEKMLNFDLNSSSELHQALLDILSETRKSNHKIQLACGLFLESKSTFATYNGSIILKRSDQVGQILNSSSDLKLIEGNFKYIDKYVFSTQQVASFHGEIKQKLSQNFELDTIITSIVPSIHSQEDSSLNALAFVEILKLDNPEKQDVVFRDNLIENSNNIGQSNLEITNNINDDEVKSSKKRIHTFLTLLKKAVTALLKILLAFLNKIISIIKISFSRDVYLGAEKKRKYFKIFFVFLIATILIIATTTFVRSKVNEEINLANAELSPILAQLDEAQLLSSSNPIEARNITQESIEKLKQVAKDFENKKHASQIINEELVKAENFSNSISGLKEFPELPLFFDLRLVESNFVAQQSDLSNNIAIFLDSEKKMLISLNLENKQVKTINLDSIARIADISANDTIYNILGNGIHQYDSSNEILNTIKEEGDSDKNGIFIQSYGVYLYVFNAEKRNIYRYTIGNDQKLSEPIGWLTNKQNLDFADIKSMAIDGDLWLSSKNGEIRKYTRGEPANFEMQNLPEPTTTPLLIYTKENLSNLYILEPQKNRLLILQKNGQFLREIKSESLVSATSLFVNEELSSAYAVSGSIIFEIKL